MAEKRMFSNKITDSDSFSDMTLAAQALYFHLNMHADDDGIVNNPRRILKAIGATDEAFQELINKRFLLIVDGITIVKHWRMNNTIREDRKMKSAYPDVLAQLTIKENGAYTLKQKNGNQPTKPQPIDRQMTGECLANVGQMSGICLTNDGQTTDERQANACVDKNSIVKDSIEENSIGETQRVRARARKYDPDTVDPGEINRLFVEFWELYPKKTNEDAACRAWVSMVDSVELAQEIIQAVKENNRRNTSWKRNGGRYVPNAENWLFDRRWRDEIREEKDDSPKEKDPFQVEGSGFEFMDEKWLEDFKERKRIEKEKLLKEKKEAALHGADTNAANMG